MQATAERSFSKCFGPGILFAGAAIGTSHLVQSTRAGAVYGLGLFVVVVLANLVRYPAFRFGPQYAAATGRSLLHGYHLRGRVFLLVFVLLELAMTPIIIAATAVVTAGILASAAGLDIDARLLGVALVFAAVALRLIGGFRLLDGLTKVFVLVLSVTTLTATVLALPDVQWDFGWPEIRTDDLLAFGFILGLVGFMPSGMDASVLQSLWTVAKRRATGHRPSVAHAVLDFNIGYVGTAILALCFLIMGAGVMHANDIEPADGAAKFAGQIIALYTGSLGEWAGFVVGAAAFFVMFTTLMAIVDGFPRMLATGFNRLRQGSAETDNAPGSRLMVVVTILLACVASAVLLFLMQSFKAFIDFVTISAFLVAPVIALLNHLVICSGEVPADCRPGKFMRAWSTAAVSLMALLAITYLIVRFG